MKKTESIKKYEVVALLRDAKWQVNQMKQTHFSKADLLEILDDIIDAVCKETE